MDKIGPVVSEEMSKECKFTDGWLLYIQMDMYNREKDQMWKHTCTYENQWMT